MPEPEIVPEFALDHKRLQQLRDYNFRPQTILDIGASNGVWSGTCARVFPEAEYFLVEPQVYPKLYPLPPGTRHHWIRQAVGRSEGPIELQVPGGQHSLFRAHVLPSPRGDLSHTLTVPQTTVDRLLETGAIAPPQLVKLDVQGYELEVLEGATRLWACAKVFIVETSFYPYWKGCPLFEDVIAYFAKRGFHVGELSTEVRVAPSDILSQIDLIFVPRACKMSYLMAPGNYPLWDRAPE